MDRTDIRIMVDNVLDTVEDVKGFVSYHTKRKLEDLHIMDRFNIYKGYLQTLNYFYEDDKENATSYCTLEQVKEFIITECIEHDLGDVGYTIEYSKTVVTDRGRKRVIIWEDVYFTCEKTNIKAIKYLESLFTKYIIDKCQSMKGKYFCIQIPSLKNKHLKVLKYLPPENKKLVTPVSEPEEEKKADQHRMIEVYSDNSDDRNSVVYHIRRDTDEYSMFDITDFLQRAIPAMVFGMARTAGSVYWRAYVDDRLIDIVRIGYDFAPPALVSTIKDLDLDTMFFKWLENDKVTELKQPDNMLRSCGTLHITKEGYIYAEDIDDMIEKVAEREEKKIPNVDESVASVEKADVSDVKNEIRKSQEKLSKDSHKENDSELKVPDTVAMLYAINSNDNYDTVVISVSIKHSASTTFDFDTIFFNLMDKWLNVKDSLENAYGIRYISYYLNDGGGYKYLNNVSRPMKISSFMIILQKELATTWINHAKGMSKGSAIEQLRLDIQKTMCDIHNNAKS